MHGIIPFLSKDTNIPTFGRIQILLTCGPQGKAVLHGNLCILEEFWSLPQTKYQGGIGSEWGFLQIGTMIGSKGLSQVPVAYVIPIPIPCISPSQHIRVECLSQAQISVDMTA